LPRENAKSTKRNTKKSLIEIAAKNTCKPFQKEYIRKDGSRVPVIVGASAFEDNVADTGIAYILDITELKSAENKIKKAIPTDNPKILMNARVLCLDKFRQAVLK